MGIILFTETLHNWGLIFMLTYCIVVGVGGYSTGRKATMTENLMLILTYPAHPALIGHVNRLVRSITSQVPNCAATNDIGDIGAASFCATLPSDSPYAASIVGAVVDLAAMPGVMYSANLAI